MGNMSYCRFQNTLQDLRDCYDNMDDDDLSTEETKAKERLIKLCERIAEAHGVFKDVQSQRDALLDVAEGILVDDLLPYLPAEYIAKVRAAIAKATAA